MWCLRFSYNGHLLACGASDAVTRLWSTNGLIKGSSKATSGGQEHRLTGHTRCVVVLEAE